MPVFLLAAPRIRCLPRLLVLSAGMMLSACGVQRAASLPAETSLAGMRQLTGMRQLIGTTASASSSELGNGPANVLDGNLSTRWSGNGTGVTLTVDFGKPVLLTGAGAVQGPPASG